MYKVIPPDQAPQLYKAFRDLCAKAGIEAPLIAKPTMFFASQYTLAEWDITAIKTPEGESYLVVGDKIRKILGHTHLKAEVSEELLGVLAHEVKHLKYDLHVGRLLTMRAAPALGCMAPLGGYALYQEIIKKRPSITPELDTKQQDADELNRHVEAAKPAGMNSTFIKLAKYVAAGALGLISGVAVSKLFHNHIEYGADAFSRELLGSGEPMAKALELMKPHIDDAFKDISFMQRIYEWVLHPPIDARIAHLRS